MLMRKTMAPIRLTRRIGRTLNEVMPSQAKASIFFNGYLEVPALRR